MDKVRAFVSVVWTQRFWVLSVLCAIVGVVCWNMAASNLQAEFAKRKSAINSAYSSVSGIKNEQVHPNDDVNAGDLRQARQQKDIVLKAWQELYDAQRTEVLYWPESLGKEFVANMQGRKFGDDIKSEDRGFYHDYIGTRFDALLEIVKAKKTASQGGGTRRGGYGGGRGAFGGEGGAAYGAGVDDMLEDDDEGYLVQWIDQAKLQQKLLFKKKPSSLKVWVTQEDLWVYETLLKVIADTNNARGATRPDNTAVRAIVDLQVGSQAADQSTGQILMPQSGGAEEGSPYGGRGGEAGGYGMGMGNPYGGGGGGNPYGGRGGGYGGGGGEGGASDANLTANRYLDAEGKPDPGGVESIGAREFRQLPIRMRLKMDERWIPRILLECANAALPIEVEQVRINPDVSGAGFGGGGRSNSARGLRDTTGMADVVIRGAVYIYNEPDMDKLSIPGEEESTLADAGN